jgi:hypothetical protein
MRARGALLRWVGRLEQRTLLLGLAVAAAGAVIGGFAWLSTNGVSFSGRYPFTVILPASTPPLPAHAEVRIAGKIAGGVTSVQPRSGSLRVQAYINRSYGTIGRGASVHVGVLIGTTLVYLVLHQGDYRHPLPPNSVIPAARVTASSSLPQALQAFDAQTRRALARNLTVIGEGWIGRGAETNTALGQLPGGLVEGTPLVRAMAPRRGVLAHLVAALAPVTAALRGHRRDDVAAGTTGAATFWRTLAGRSRVAVATARFAGAERRLLETLPAARASLRAATDAVRAALPLVGAVRREEPDLLAVVRGGAALLAATTRFNRHAPALMRALIPLLQVLVDPARSLPLLGRDGSVLASNIDAYARDWNAMGTNLHAATSYTFDGKPAIRLTGTLGGCSAGYDAYPAPDQAAKDRGSCR